MSVNKYLFLPLIIFAALIGYDSFSQKKTKADYERERAALQKKIKLGQGVIEEIQKEKATSLGALRAIKEQIAARRQLILTIKKEKELLEQEYSETTDIITGMQNDTARLKKEYAQMIYEQYKANNNYQQLTYVFSAKSYGELTMRMEYLNQFNKVRETQVRKIEQVMEMLKAEIDKLAETKKEKEELEKKLKSEKSMYDELRARENSVVEKLSEREGEQRKEIEKWQKRQKELDNIIKKLIEAEIKKTEKKNNNNLKERKGLELLSKNFEANKGRLPWPLERCSITRKFGPHKDPLLGITVNNLGIGLMTQRGTPVKAVFDGKVSIVTTIRGQNKMVMVKHGTYFTVYINLASVDVTMGQEIKTGQTIGTVHTNSDGLTELEFHVWKGNGANSQKLNPEHWLHR